MKKYFFLAVLVAISAAFANKPTTHVKVENPWARVVGEGKNGAVYMDITAHADDKLLRAESGVAKKIELHTHVVNPETGVAKMMAVKHMDLLTMKPVHLKPGSLHIMLLGLTKPLKAGDVFDLTLKFEKSAPLTLSVPIKNLDGTDTDKKKSCGCHH